MKIQGIHAYVMKITQITSNSNTGNPFKYFVFCGINYNLCCHTSYVRLVSTSILIRKSDFRFHIRANLHPLKMCAHISFSLITGMLMPHVHVHLFSVNYLPVVLNLIFVLVTAVL